jgi:hypothetical protein
VVVADRSTAVGGPASKGTHEGVNRAEVTPHYAHKVSDSPRDPRRGRDGEGDLFDLLSAASP